MTNDETGRLRDEILLATLRHVPFDGWTRKALRRGAADCGCEAEAARRAFPGGPAGLAEYYSRYADREMLAAIEKIDLAPMRATERVGAVVWTRLEQSGAHREAIRRVLGFLALPQNGLLAARCMYRTVDAIWRAAGDESTDWNFYSKRGLLAGVFGATVLYWLNDESEDFADTRAFLDRRLGDAAKCGKATAKIMQFCTEFGSPFSAYRPTKQ